MALIIPPDWLRRILVLPEPFPPIIEPKPTPPTIKPEPTPPTIKPEPTPPTIKPEPTPPVILPEPVISDWLRKLVTKSESELTKEEREKLNAWMNSRMILIGTLSLLGLLLLLVIEK